MGINQTDNETALREELGSYYSEDMLDSAIFSFKKYGRTDGRILKKFVSKEMRLMVSKMTNIEKIDYLAKNWNI